jgi:hypothetical protein
MQRKDLTYGEFLQREAQFASGSVTALVIKGPEH